MTDPVERGQEREQEMRQDALAERARRAQTEAGDSALVCVECEQEIPEARRLAVSGCQLCIECKRDAERWNR